MGAATRKIELVANIASGSVGPSAPEEARQILAIHGVEANIRAPAPEDLMETLRSAVDAAPDLLVVLAGDGTARAAAELCGPDGPVIAPLAGGTMNMLPYALYGRRPWQEALASVLESGEEHPLAGGEVEGHGFLVAAILGAPALWAPAREAVRRRDLRSAVRRAGVAWRRAFNGRVRYSLDVGPKGKAEAVSFLCPLTSRAMRNEAPALEAVILTPEGAADAFRLAVNAATGDWRRDPSAHSTPCRTARLWASGSIPALLDGEPVRLPRRVEVRHRPKVARVMLPPSP